MGVVRRTTTVEEGYKMQIGMQMTLRNDFEWGNDFEKMNFEENRRLSCCDVFFHLYLNNEEDAKCDENGNNPGTQV